MTALTVEWVSGGPFIAILLTGILLGVALCWIVAGIRTLDTEEQHRRAVRALRRIFVGLNAGWTNKQAIDEAARALQLDHHQRLARHLKLDQLPVVHTTAEWTIDLMRQGMRSGRSSLMVLIPVRVDNSNAIVAAELSLNSWMMATAVLRGACRDEVDQPGWALLNDEARAVLLPRFAESITRAVPTATAEQALEAASMMLDAIGADAPPDTGEAG